MYCCLSDYKAHHNVGLPRAECIYQTYTPIAYLRNNTFSSSCTSYVGMRGGAQTLSLEDHCIERHGTIMHEFLHAFGYYHEHQREDRDDYVTIYWDNIQPGE